jgi:threonyl-tRNA synthetase
MLQRVYGTAWESVAQLKAHKTLKSPHMVGLFCPCSRSLLTLVWSAQAYKTMVEEAKKRDHRKLGQELDLFSIQEQASSQKSAYSGSLFRI